MEPAARRSGCTLSPRAPRNRGQGTPGTPRTPCLPASTAGLQHPDPALRLARAVLALPPAWHDGAGTCVPQTWHPHKQQLNRALLPGAQRATASRVWDARGQSPRSPQHQSTADTAETTELGTPSPGFNHTRHRVLHPEHLPLCRGHQWAWVRRRPRSPGHGR